MNDLSKLSWQELIALYEKAEQAGDSAKLEVLEAEMQRRVDLIRKGLIVFAEKFQKSIESASQIIINFRNAVRKRLLLLQYKQDIKRVEQLLKYTKHSKKRQEHERYLKWLKKQVDVLRSN